ncbi:hypothetical protein ACCO45_007566 [Purpureocillium lilacinum]|uniref:Uncharacterized protein n=1 Tax=Purpureocillium lilacinum TaxID=33203 RepID=A0ACC4DSV0_PURLI
MFSRHAPYDVHSRFSDIDSDHRGGILWIAALLSMVYSVLSCIMAGLAQTLIVICQLLSGYGTSISLLDPTSILAIQKLGFVANILFIFTLSLAKLSVVWFLGRLTPNVNLLKSCSALAVACGLWGAAGALSLALRCDLAHPWLVIGVDCPNLARLKAVTDSSSADHDCAVSEIESTGDGVRRVSDDGSQDLFIRESETQERNSGAAEMSLRG